MFKAAPLAYPRVGLAEAGRHRVAIYWRLPSDDGYLDKGKTIINSAISASWPRKPLGMRPTSTKP